MVLKLVENEKECQVLCLAHSWVYIRFGCPSYDKEIKTLIFKEMVNHALISDQIISKLLPCDTALLCIKLFWKCRIAIYPCESCLYTDIIFKRLAAVPECIVVRLVQRFIQNGGQSRKICWLYALIVWNELVQRTTGSTGNLILHKQ